MFPCYLCSARRGLETGFGAQQAVLRATLARRSELVWPLTPEDPNGTREQRRDGSKKKKDVGKGGGGGRKGLPWYYTKPVIPYLTASPKARQLSSVP